MQVFEGNITALISPKISLGELRTFRNAGVDEYLLERLRIKGVIMVSAVFDLRTLFFAPN